MIEQLFMRFVLVERFYTTRAGQITPRNLPKNPPDTFLNEIAFRDLENVGVFHDEAVDVHGAPSGFSSRHHFITHGRLINKGGNDRRIVFQRVL